MIAPPQTHHRTHSSGKCTAAEEDTSRASFPVCAVKSMSQFILTHSGHPTAFLFRAYLGPLPLTHQPPKNYIYPRAHVASDR